MYDDKKVNFDKLAELIEEQISKGTKAIVICGSTGEASTLTDSEHKEVIKFTVEKVNGRICVVAGVGSNYTEHAIELSQYAESVGADALLSVVPYYNKPTQSGMYKHFEKVANSVSCPVILYNVPSRTIASLSVETVYKLSKIKNIVGIKECDFSHIGKIRKMCGDDFLIYSGEDSNVLPVLALGGNGIISVLANVAPEKMSRLCEAYFEGNIEESRQLQLDMLELVDALFIESSPVPVKEALNLMGKEVGMCRLPLDDLTESSREILIKALTDYGCLK